MMQLDQFIYLATPTNSGGKGGIKKHIPNVAKHLRTGGYQTAMVGKWHLGESVDSQPTGFDYWSVLPDQGHYWDPDFTEPDGEHIEPGYVTDIITNISLNWIKTRDRNRSFFLLCHHKVPYRLPDTFSDNYRNRAKAGKVAKMRVAEDFTYQDLGLVQPDGGRRVGEPGIQEKGNSERKIPAPTTDVELWSMRVIGKDDGTGFTFQSHPELAEFKFQRYMQRYLHAIQSVDDNLAENMIVIYTSNEGFFLGEQSFQMPFLIRYPREIRAGPVAYHRYWMHNDVIHHAYANYGIRNQTYKLIYWYNEPLGVKGARSGGEEHKEWELFDCEQYPLELFNVYHERDYQQVAREMTALLEKKMVEIRDEPILVFCMFVKSS
ncbi:alkaline-phosphatase-like protein [Aspergillus alliaceus]|uniref:alkaline-phosphatase-like protein n=1 Tax=Petromyces alliaceus TaxID=209559 RepID=UPI0012A5E4B1|nr:alkaline-phosphatase-like protein [Aspergillus alliaceus]KAB8229712.1 alkaline-phosphatase-like protein [Aspergillus alliaceus]